MQYNIHVGKPQVDQSQGKPRSRKLGHVTVEVIVDSLSSVQVKEEDQRALVIIWQLYWDYFHSMFFFFKSFFFSFSFLKN